MRDDIHFDGFTVRTTFNNGKLITVVDATKAGGFVGRIDHMVVDIQEEHVKQSLAQLGWTPPRIPGQEEQDG